jgi:hypothetical protein
MAEILGARAEGGGGGVDDAAAGVGAARATGAEEKARRVGVMLDL